jgi:hypothetical protein
MSQIKQELFIIETISEGGKTTLDQKSVRKLNKKLANGAVLTGYPAQVGDTVFVELDISNVVEKEAEQLNEGGAK